MICSAAYANEQQAFVHTNSFGCVVESSSRPSHIGNEKFGVDNILLCPDRELTPDQLAIKLKLMYVDAFLLDCTNNSPRLTVGQEYFIANGIPVEYYDDIVNRSKAGAEELEKMHSQHNFSKLDMSQTRKELRAIYTLFFQENAENGILFEDFILREFAKMERHEPSVFAKLDEMLKNTATSQPVGDIPQ